MTIPLIPGQAVLLTDGVARVTVIDDTSAALVFATGAMRGPMGRTLATLRPGDTVTVKTVTGFLTVGESVDGIKVELTPRNRNS